MTTSTTVRPRLSRDELAARIEQAQHVNFLVGKLTDDVNEGVLQYLEMVPEWAHEAIAEWADDLRHSLSEGWMHHVESAVRCFYSVERKSRRDEEKVREEVASMGRLAGTTWVTR